jgi:hypothetical protein
MIRRKLVDASIALIAFFLLGVVGGVLLPRVAQAAPAWWEYCDLAMATCPAATGNCTGCAAVGLRGTCQVGNFWDGCWRTPNACLGTKIPPAVGSCSCNSDAC